MEGGRASLVCWQSATTAVVVSSRLLPTYSTYYFQLNDWKGNSGGRADYRCDYN